MGGSIRKDFDYNRITHLIANKVGGEKYQYAVTFNIPVMSASWVHAAWENRHDLGFKATEGNSVIFYLKIFTFVTYLKQQNSYSLDEEYVENI